MTASTARKVFKVKGTTNEVTECELCGRVDLKGTIVLATLDADGNEEGVVYYGASCGAKAAGWTTKDVRKAAKTADDDAREARRAASQAESDAYCAARDAWLIEQHGTKDVLGCYAKKFGYPSSYAVIVAFEEATGRR
jgi:hypothetical protein